MLEMLSTMFSYQFMVRALIVGENGSGKSTLVKGLLGLISPVSGRVRYGDGLRRTEIGYLPQRTDVQNDFPASVWEVVSSGCRGRGPFLTRAMRQTAMENMALMDISGIRDQSFMRLTSCKGHAQRGLAVGLRRAQKGSAVRHVQDAVRIAERRANVVGNHHHCQPALAVEHGDHLV